VKPVQPLPLLKAKNSSMCLLLMFHSMRVADSLVLSLVAIQYRVPLVSAMPGLSLVTSTAQQVPYLGALCTTQVWRALPGRRLLSVFRLSTNVTGSPNSRGQGTRIVSVT
jgi:hypothetical protein